jgi:hypothetical protein
LVETLIDSQPGRFRAFDDDCAPVSSSQIGGKEHGNALDLVGVYRSPGVSAFADHNSAGNEAEDERSLRPPGTPT